MNTSNDVIVGISCNIQVFETYYINLILLYMFAPEPFLNTNLKTFHNSIHYSDYIHYLSIYNVLGLAMHVRTYCNTIKIQVIFSKVCLEKKFTPEMIF